MSGNRPIIYWDSCVFLAWLKDEKRKAGQMAGVQSCVIEIESGKWELITSAIAFTEVLEAKIGSDINKKFQELFLRPNITAINADIRVAKLASELRGYYIKSGEVRSLTTPDAIHLATAILYDADEFHTFDDGKSNKKYLGLLDS
jgi:predicted nucleic acid-binding protein